MATIEEVKQSWWKVVTAPFRSFPYYNWRFWCGFTVFYIIVTICAFTQGYPFLGALGLVAIVAGVVNTVIDVWVERSRKTSNN